MDEYVQVMTGPAEEGGGGEGGFSHGRRKGGPGPWLPKRKFGEGPPISCHKFRKLPL